MGKLILSKWLRSLLGIANAFDFSEGQIWAYKTRPCEEKSSLIINKVESDPKLGKIFHISISQIKVRNPLAANEVISELPHFPVSEVTLNKSVTKLLGTSQTNKEYIEGYKDWKRAFDQGKAGVFTISIAEIVDVVEKAINEKQILDFNAKS